MKSELEINKLVRSRALGASLLLHGLVLVGLGLGTLSAIAPEHGELVVYLAMPTAIPERVPVTTATSEEKTIPETLHTRPIRQAQLEPEEVVVQPPAKILVLEDKPLPEPVPSQAVVVPEQPEIIPEVVETAYNAEPKESAFVGLPELDNDGMETLTRNQKPETRNRANALLAFAGDPAVLGMLARNALGSDLIEAQTLFLPEPAYPILSRRRGEEGRVVLEIEISAKGAVRRAKVQSSSSYLRLDRAALEAIKTAVFSPATAYGKPVESMAKVAYTFRLEEQ